jgi:anaerobic magnesium-protoporphyrin IX monomethyl ester cyclase
MKNGTSHSHDLDPSKFVTSPWAVAIQQTGEGATIPTYPCLDGMKVTIVIPDDYYRKKLMPLGPGYVTTAMKRCGIEVSMLDCSAWSYDDIEIAQAVIQSDVQIYAIGALYPMIREVERVCNIIKALKPNSTIILGGSLPSPIPEFALRQTGADIATIGEAEITIPVLMAALAGNGNLADVRGIAYLDDGQFVDNGKPILPRRATKEEVGWPDREIYPVERYIQAPKFYPFQQTDRILPIVTGRGCPYSCNFCFRVNSYRIRPFDDLFEEMEYLIDRYRLNGFYIVDDLLMNSEKKITEFCEGVIDRGLNIKYNCTGRVNTVTPKIAKLLSASGCNSIYYGLEAGNQEILETMSKKTTLEQIYEAVRLTRENDIFCSYGVMFGQPGETEETLRDSVDLLKKISYGGYRASKIFGCIPFPGTGLYDWCKETGRIKDDADFYNRYICQDWSLDQIPINMTDIPDDKVNVLFKEANTDLSNFYMEKMTSDWATHFGSAECTPEGTQSGVMAHIADRIEATENTFDTSGRS